MTARIVQLSRSDGGVPKLPVEEVEVTPLGLAGDRQKHTKIHGGPDRAVCLFSLEVIEGLQVHGHPITPGSTGENVTISGLRWADLAPGRRVALGSDVIVELTWEATPCKQIRSSFKDRKFTPLSVPGQMRWYSRVLQPGIVRVDMRVALL